MGVNVVPPRFHSPELPCLPLGGTFPSAFFMEQEPITPSLMQLFFHVQRAHHVHGGERTAAARAHHAN
eukprot:scaffold312785_cov20-Tisochrysis_lutea.AAC.1